jgi:crossover junction endodeoxyribonuclease RuvC
VAQPDPWLTVVGIDPGLADSGVGIVSGLGMRIHGCSYGSIHTRRQQPLPVRLETIYDKLGEVLQQAQPDLMVVEDVFSLERYPRSGITLGKVTGVILLAASRRRIPVVEVPVREAKQVLTGNGNASKQQLEKAVRERLRLDHPVRPYHASDALGLALIGLYRQGGRQANLRPVEGCDRNGDSGAR